MSASSQKGWTRNGKENGLFRQRSLVPPLIASLNLRIVPETQKRLLVLDRKRLVRHEFRRRVDDRYVSLRNREQQVKGWSGCWPQLGWRKEGWGRTRLSSSTRISQMSIVSMMVRMPLMMFEKMS